MLLRLPWNDGILGIAGFLSKGNLTSITRPPDLIAARAEENIRHRHSFNPPTKNADSFRVHGVAFVASLAPNPRTFRCDVFLNGCFSHVLKQALTHKAAEIGQPIGDLGGVFV
jgi:hypothetical protein